MKEPTESERLLDWREVLERPQEPAGTMENAKSTRLRPIRELMKKDYVRFLGELNKLEVAFSQEKEAYWQWKKQEEERKAQSQKKDMGTEKALNLARQFLEEEYDRLQETDD